MEKVKKEEVTGQIIFNDMKQISNVEHRPYVYVQWKNIGNKFGYAWDDIDISVAFKSKGNITEIEGIMFPDDLMPETLAKVNLGKGMYKECSEKDAAIIIQDAMNKFGFPTNYGT